LKIHFIGTGTAGTLKNYHTNFLIEQNGKFMLIDAGSDIRFSLRDFGKSMTDIDAVYISHLHGDHSGGIESLGFGTFFIPGKKRSIKLYGNGEVLQNGWAKTWSGGMESLQEGLIEGIANLDTYFDTMLIHKNGMFEWEGLECYPVQSVHIMSGYSTIPSYGLMVATPEGQKVYFTTDTQYCPHQIKSFMEMSDLVICDCECTPFISGVHANFSEWIQFPKNLKEKMLLTHYQDFVLAEDGKSISDEWRQKAIDAGFIGFAARGETIDTDKHFINMETIR
jgi:ribonuclease BN (tRNA processing enzyme)